MSGRATKSAVVASIFGGSTLSKEMPLKEIINLSTNQTLSRTTITSLTVLVVVVAIRLFSGGAVEALAFTLFIGVIVGTYSTVFIACAMACALGGGKILKKIALEKG